MKRVLTSLVALGFTAGVVLVAQDAKLVQQGKKVYETQKCADCHTIGGKGGRLTKQYPMDDVGTKLSAADIKQWIVAPAEMEAKAKPTKLKMSSKKYNLSAADVDALVAYMQTLKK